MNYLSKAGARLLHFGAKHPTVVWLIVYLVILLGIYIEVFRWAN